MSVSLFTSTEACKIANSLPEKFARSVWYSYVSNVTAYNLQYNEKELIDFCKETLAGFKVPKQVIFCELPKTSTGKIQKFELRKQF